ncbi:MAG: PQQ-dependent sugar dehydrogenase [Acidimicrobiia bacterium]|nr:PQQ-dependent sugar dehydrogenase [Acidimicrobiia bacterium]MDH5504904.1 PQQ-dependent sugar dehydrogenase [Acidimicrobiia bacterium]
MFRITTGIVVVATFIGLTALVASAVPPGGTFVDDDGNVHEANIEALAAAGITRGCNPPVDDRFCPDGTVTRGEMAAFLSRALDLTERASDPFGDDDGSLFEADIERIAAAGITRGCNPPANDRFCPTRPVTRAEMAAFLVRAYSYVDRADGRFTDDDGSIFEEDIERLAASGVTLGCNPPANDHYCPSKRVRRDEMASFLVRAEGLAPIPVPPRLTPALDALPFSFDSPIQVAGPPGDSRVFVAERSGKVRVIIDGNLLADPLIDLSGTVIQGGERGLLGVAFHPDFVTNGLVYVSYSAETASLSANHASVVEEFKVSGNQVTPSTGRVVFTTLQPYANHNGGMIMFGPDGYLYLGLGDGGSAFDPARNGQNPKTALGSMVRIDTVAATSSNWAIGLRNPWRWWIDGSDMYIADVGQGSREEISVVSTTDTGLNLGWVRFEGSQCTGLGSCSTSGLTFPVLEYTHAEGCSITGGVVYRGDLTQLNGHFLYGDYCSGWIRSIRVVGGSVVSEGDLTSLGAAFGLVSFGQDGLGNTYVIRGGTVYQLVGE